VKPSGISNFAAIAYKIIPNRVCVDEKEVKVNIFDMAGHPIFYEVHECCLLYLFS
jgi:hypothetical protein